MNPGDVIGGRFALEQHVANGAMGMVFRGHDRSSGDLVAVKLLRGDAVSDIHRFHREAELLAQLSHPGIVRYIAHGETSAGRPYLVQEWLDGETLADKLARDGVTPSEAVDLTRRVAESLACAHAAEIIHRDIKPANLLLLGGDCARVTVLDFSIARREQPDFHVTSTGAVVGSPGYMAPEQARGSRDITVCVDVFALGCVLYECLTGRAAFPGRNLMAICAKILLLEPEPLTARCPGLPDALSVVVARMLAKEPADRLPDAAAVARALAAVAGVPDRPRRRRGVPLAETLASASAVDAGTSELPTLAGTLDEAGTLCSFVLLSAAPGGSAPPAEVIRAACADRGRIARIGDEAVAVLVLRRGTAREHAARAADIALELQRLAPGHGIAIASAAAPARGDGPVDALADTAAAAIDTGTHVLEVAELHALFSDLSDAGASRIWLDGLTASLLAGAYRVEPSARGWWLADDDTIDT